MSIELAEKLKQKLTDKWVVVDPAAPELKRFANWTGKVRTVNMNGRALVEFDGPVDIGWYDIDPAFLTVVDAPKPKAPPAPAKKEAPAAKPAAAAPAAAAPAGGSPLDKIRAQQAAKTSGAAAPTTAAPAGEKKLSPIEIMRAQQAAKAAAAGGTAPAAPVAAAPAPVEVPAAAPAEVPAAKPPVPTTGADGKKLSPLEMARLQGAAKKPS